MQVCLYSTLLSCDMLQPTEVLCCTEDGPSVVPKYVSKYVMQVCQSHFISNSVFANVYHMLCIQPHLESVEGTVDSSS